MFSSPSGSITVKLKSLHVFVHNDSRLLFSELTMVKKAPIIYTLSDPYVTSNINTLHDNRSK